MMRQRTPPDRARTTARRAVAGVCLTSLLAGCSPTSSGGTNGATSAPAASGTPAPAGSHDAGGSQLRQVDRNALAALVRSGGNRICSHDIENEIVVPTEADGDAIAAELPQSTYFVRVARNSSGNGALAIVEQSLVPTDAAIVAMVATMTRVARAHHGTYDRWETEPTKHC